MPTLLRTFFFFMGLAWLTAASAQTPVLSDNADSIAVVVGNKEYRRTSTVDVAHNDAEAIKAYLTGTLGFRDRRVGLRLHAARQALRRGLFEARGINQREVQIAKPAKAFAPITGDARLVVDQRQPPPDQTIKQRRFSYVWPSYNGNNVIHNAF